MPRAKQLTVWVPDQPGMLGEVGSALGAKKANILAFTAWVEGDRGAIRMVVDKPAVAKKVSVARGWETTEEEVLEVTLAHSPGSLGRIAQKLGEVGVNIHDCDGDRTRQRHELHVHCDGDQLGRNRTCFGAVQCGYRGSWPPKWWES